MRKKTTRTVTAVLLALALTVTLTIVALSGVANSKAELKVTGFRLRLNEADNSIQALVTVSMTNLEWATGASFKLGFDPVYLEPSHYVTNAAIGTAAETQAFFSLNEALYLKNEGGDKFSPFMQKAELDAANLGLSYGGVDITQGTMSASFILSRELAKDPTMMPTDLTMLNRVEIKDNTGEYSFYMKSGGANEVKLGELSFCVKREKLDDLIALYKAGNLATVLSITAEPYWQQHYLVDEGKAGFVPKTYRSGTDDAKAEMFIELQLPRTLLEAELVAQRVVVNAYQAYGGVGWADLAAVLQTHSPTVRVKYSDGQREDVLLKWGDPALAAGYTVEKLAADGLTYNKVDTATETYDPTGGTYRISQKFIYNTDEAYPQPMVATVVVTQVTLQSVTANATEKTYNTEADSASDAAPPNTYRLLRLPDTAQLAVTPIPGAASLTIPIGAWDPPNDGNLLAGNLTDKSSGAVWPASGTYRFARTYTQGELQAEYPWMTVPNASYELNALRTIVADDAEFTDAANYTATAGSDDNGVLTVEVKKTGATDITPGGTIRLRLPNGVEVSDNWFDNAGVNFKTMVSADGTGWTVTLSSVEALGFPTLDFDNRETARRYINLGGWFSVAVKENADPDVAFSDFIPVYAAPRANRYVENYTVATASAGDGGHFDFTGNLAGVFPFYPNTVLGKQIVLPTGYHVVTTYDGATGGEYASSTEKIAGELASVRVETPWVVSGKNSVVTPDPIDGWPEGTQVTHGPQPFATKAYFDGYGRVWNNQNSKQVELLTQVRGTTLAPVEKIVLTAPDTAGITENATGEVTGVVYDTKRQGYLYRQEYTLTLENRGTTDVYGLYLDVGYAPTPAGESHFEIIKQPAAYVPAGGKTTFVVTYLMDLKADQSAGYTDYLDTISVHTNSGGDTALKTFTAGFRVSYGVVSTVTVVTNHDDKMGTGKLIVGLPPKEPADGAIVGDKVTSTTEKPNLDDGLKVYNEDYKWVWVYAQPDDEYEVEEVYYYKDDVVDENGKVSLHIYEYTNPMDNTDKVTAYFFQMPDYDVTVHVDFFEPLYSKLRMSELYVYGGTDAEVVADSLVDLAHTHKQPIHRMDDTTAVVDGDKLQWDVDQTAGTDNRQVEKFLVVLDKDDTRVQIGTLLRWLLSTQAVGENIAPDVWMYWESGDGTLNNIYGESTDREGGTTGRPGATPPEQVSEHISKVFPAPPRGEYITAHILMRSVLPVEERHFEIRIARRGENVVHTLDKGNSPYGMIENDKNIIDKAAAKDAFDKAGNHFTVGAATTPVKAAGLTNSYWAAAWGAGGNYDKDDTALFVYLGAAFEDPGFLPPTGQSGTGVLNSAGVEVKAEDIRRSVVVAALDTTAPTQVGRFSGSDELTLTLGTADKAIVDQVTHDIGGTPKTVSWWVNPADDTTYPVRPGVYRLTYTFIDYDGITERDFDRPLIVLAPVGDVDADLDVTAAADGSHLAKRVADPLGYTAGDTNYPECALFKYRVCDVNNDRNINNIDRNALEKSTVPTAFYKPTEYKNK